jgi:hypothetical protein
MHFQHHEVYAILRQAQVDDRLLVCLVCLVYPQCTHVRMNFQLQCNPVGLVYTCQNALYTTTILGVCWVAGYV